MDSDYDSPPESIYEEPPDDSDADENYVPDDEEEEEEQYADDALENTEDTETQMAGDFECVNRVLASCTIRRSMTESCIVISMLPVHATVAL